MAIPTRPEFEALIYGLGLTYPAIVASTLRLYSTSALTARVEGEITFSNGLRLRVLEVLDFKNREIRQYSYEIYRGSTKIRWYDPQPHPDDATLAATFPHHYHVEPDIKHNRQPAPGLSFSAPNLPTLIGDCLKIA